MARLGIEPVYIYIYIYICTRGWAEKFICWNEPCFDIISAFFYQRSRCSTTLLGEVCRPQGDIGLKINFLWSYSMRFHMVSLFHVVKIFVTFHKIILGSLQTFFEYAGSSTPQTGVQPGAEENNKKWHRKKYFKLTHKLIFNIIAISSNTDNSFKIFNLIDRNSRFLKSTNHFY